MLLLQIGAITSNSIASVSSSSSVFLTSPFALKVYYFFKIILIIYSFILFAAIILLLVTSKPKKAAQEVKVSIESIIGREKIEGASAVSGGWNEIIELAESGQESSWRLAVIEADKFFDDVLRRLGYSGENFGERLKQVHPSEIENINDVWSAHRIRNSLSHDVNFKMTEGEAKKAVAAFQKAMEDLDVI